MPFDPSTARPANAAFDPSTAQALQPAAPVAAGPAAAPQQPDQGGGAGDMLKDAGDMLFTALHSAADTATFGLADKASAGLAYMISPLTGQPMSYDEAYQKIQQNNQEMRARNPVSAAVGDVGGMVVGAGGIAKVAKAIPGVGAAMEAMAPVAKAPVTNVLKSAAVGGGSAAAYTAADEGIRQGEIDPNTVLVNGALGAVAAPVISKVGQAIAAKLVTPTTKAMNVLASKIDETPATLQRVYDNFQTATGRVPTMAEIVGMKSTGELSQLAANSPTISAAANEAADTAGAQRTKTLAAVVDQNGGGPQDINQLITARKTNMDAAMNPIRTTPVGMDQGDVGLLDDPRVRSAIRADPNLSQRVRDAITEARDQGQSDSLTIDDIDSIRKSLRGEQAKRANPANSLHNPHIAQQFGNLADNIAALGTSSHSGYQDALDQFSKDSDYIAGFKHGNAGKTIGEADKDSLINSLQTPEGRNGYQAGIASRVGDAAGAGANSAVRTAGELAAGEGGDVAMLRGAVGQDNFQRIQDAAAAESQGAENLKRLSGRVGAEPEGESAAKHLGQAAGAIAAHSPTTMVYHAAKAIPSFKALSPAVQNKVAQYLLDPKMTQQGINLLRKAGARDDEIRKLAVALSANAGLNTAATLTN